MSKIKDFFNIIRHRYYGMAKAFAFIVATALVADAAHGQVQIRIPAFEAMAA